MIIILRECASGVSMITINFLSVFWRRTTMMHDGWGMGWGMGGFGGIGVLLVVLAVAYLVYRGRNWAKFQGSKWNCGVEFLICKIKWLVFPRKTFEISLPSNDEWGSRMQICGSVPLRSCWKFFETNNYPKIIMVIRWNSISQKSWAEISPP